MDAPLKIRRLLDAVNITPTRQRSAFRFFRRTRAETLIAHVRELSATLTDCQRGELLSEVRTVRNAIFDNGGSYSPEVLVAASALATEALRRSHRIEMYDVQLLAVLHLIQGRIIQMATGEGKTFVAVAAALVLALGGRGVHVMTPNFYLAGRDCATAKSAAAHLGLTVGLTPEQGTEAAKRLAYDCDVTYGTGHEFGFDYLRDQLTLQQQAQEPLGTRILRKIDPNLPSGRVTIQRGLAYAVVDEADSVMLDEATSPLVLSAGSTGRASDEAAHQQAMRLAKNLSAEAEYTIAPLTTDVVLTQRGVNRCYADDIHIPADVLLRPWTEYVEQALRARHVFRNGVHYVIDEGAVKIVDQTTGRIFSDRTWQDGLHQAIEAKEGLPIRPEKKALARISRQRFFRLYRNLCGMTGTAVGCEKEFHQVYRCSVERIPLHRESRQAVLPTRYFASRGAKLQAILASTIERYARGQPVLIGTQSVEDSEALAEMFRQTGHSFELLNGLQTTEEADIISRAGQRSAITIATNLAGRGTDIVISEAVRQIGGLHVIAAECQLSSRMDRQLTGRSGRQGAPGSAQIFVSADDILLKTRGPWLSEVIRREADKSGETRRDFSRAIARVQKAAEKQQYASRVALLRHDMAVDELFGS